MPEIIYDTMILHTRFGATARQNDLSPLTWGEIQSSRKVGGVSHDVLYWLNSEIRYGGLNLLAKPHSIDFEVDRMRFSEKLKNPS
jgi:hypothetical protein